MSHLFNNILHNLAHFIFTIYRKYSAISTSSISYQHLKYQLSAISYQHLKYQLSANALQMVLLEVLTADG
ncbi:MAG: hypothetical protein F6K56_42280 [Moorea sp. SIO3G5]|nr:hypothetical protein [Moorena sp. SIO3G5]